MVTKRKAKTKPKTTRKKAAPARVSVLSLISARGVTPATARVVLRRHGFRDPAAARRAIDQLAADATYRPQLRRIFGRLLRSCQDAADPDRALTNFERLVTALPNPGIFYQYLDAAPDRLGMLATVFAHSQALAETLTQDPAHFHYLIRRGVLDAARDKSWLESELGRLLLPAADPGARYDVARQFRRRETLRIGVRDLLGRATVEETTAELSNLADVCLQAVYETAREDVASRCRVSAEQLARLAGFAVIGMGKLGGRELNYSSDVDVIFVYGEDGTVNERLSVHEFYTQLAEEIIRAVSEPSPLGSLFRIDLRLRPEGATGPLVQPLEGCEQYYAGWGETWERMALVKARPVAGDAAVGAAFIEMIQPFVYRRHTGEQVIRQMAALKERIEKEIVGQDALERHVKLGIGGIREIEFTVQSFQVLRGAHDARLRDRSTLRTLDQLVAAECLPAADAVRLADAYRFLRNVEHRLQMELDLQTHTLPDEKQALYRLARSLGFQTVAAFQKQQKKHTAAVRQVYEGVLAEAAAAEPPRLRREDLPRLLGQVAFRDPDLARETMEGLWFGPGYVHVSQRTKELFAQLLPSLLRDLAAVPDPDAALDRFDKFTSAYGSRGLLYELFTRNPAWVEMLVRVGDASRFLSEILAGQPDLFDDVCRGLALSAPKGLVAMRRELVGLLDDRAGAAGDTGEDLFPVAMDLAREWKQSQVLRVGIEDILGLVDLESVQLELSQVAQTCLHFALERATKTTDRAPAEETLPFAIIGLGKFGGQELGYGADLDLLLVCANNTDQPSAIRVGAELIRFMQQPTALGNLYAVDARLRPDGVEGPLVSSLEAHRRYFERRAQCWERQAMTRARFIGGNPQTGAAFMKLAHRFVYGAGLNDEELADICRMRRRIETERGNQAAVAGEFKTGPGGLVDIEFIVQSLQLRHGHAHEGLRTAHTLAALNRLTARGYVDDEASYHLRRHYLFLRRVESVLRREENTSISRLPADERRLAELAARLGFGSQEEFLAQYRGTTADVRRIYETVMGPAAHKD